ncbi:MAG: transporter substrate-binding domain-containing protein, partial [Raoultibacter sp.]
MRRLAAFFLAAVLAFSLMPAVSFAAETDDVLENNSPSSILSGSPSQPVRDPGLQDELLAASEENDIDMHADAGRTLKVAFPFAKGVSETDENGVHSGTFYDWLIEISKYTGWNYEFVTSDVESGLSAIASGSCDLMGSMFYREQYLDSVIYPDYTMGANYSVLLHKPDSFDIKSFDLNTLNGKTIGVNARATEKIARLKNFLEFNNLSCTIRPYENIDDYRNCLESNEADLMLGSDIDMPDAYEVAARFKSEPHYIVTSITKPELAAELNKAMIAIYEANPSFADELYEKYFSGKSTTSIVFTNEDRAFVEAAGPIRVSVVANRYPI